ncbi:MAG: IS21 family transposase [Lysobacterales bacterium]
MPAKRLSMRKIKEVLRLAWSCGLSHRKVAESTGVSRPTVGEYVRRAKAGGLAWPLPEDLDDAALERKLFPPPPASDVVRTLPDWVQINRELKRKGVTMFLLWQEYRQRHPEGYQYSWFCDLYREWRGRRDLVMRQDHRAGEKLFIDYAGQTVGVVNAATGEVRQAQIFVAVMGASNFTFVEATWSQSLPDWIASHQRCLAFLGGVPQVLVPDNLAAGVSKAHRYDPDINPTYSEMAAHYGVAVVPARVRRPKDKAKAETGVLVVERWILAALRNQTFFTLGELNAAIAKLLTHLNDRPFRKLPGCRRSLFASLDRPALGPLPAQPYPFATWKKVRVHLDYHVEVKGHYYSVPHALAKQQLDARISDHVVELFHRSQRVASHRRCEDRGRHTTVREHMPKAHQQYSDWSPERFIRWAGDSGPATAELITGILAGRAHPQQGYRTCLGILRLGKAFGNDRLEAACARALLIGSRRYKSIESILKNGLDRQPLDDTPEPTVPDDHDNVRGPGYYQ